MGTYLHLVWVRECLLAEVGRREQQGRQIYGEIFFSSNILRTNRQQYSKRSGLFSALSLSSPVGVKIFICMCVVCLMDKFYLCLVVNFSFSMGEIQHGYIYVCIYRCVLPQYCASLIRKLVALSIGCKEKCYNFINFGIFIIYILLNFYLYNLLDSNYQFCMPL